MSGKRQCTSRECLAACRCAANTMWPRGNAHVAGACNDAYSGHSLVSFPKTSTGVVDSTHMDNPEKNQQANTVAVGVRGAR